jgi:hypothetical protein
MTRKNSKTVMKTKKTPEKDPVVVYRKDGKKPVWKISG